jgi:hypothetical protein
MNHSGSLTPDTETSTTEYLREKSDIDKKFYRKPKRKLEKLTGLTLSGEQQVWTVFRFVCKLAQA